MSSKNEFGNIAFDLPKNQSNVIKVVGVGGGGSNAINYMFQQGIKGVDFYICNTDAQALQNSGVPNKIQLGVNLTEGLGAGANPDIGEQAAVESFDAISQMLDSNTKMIFITAGMGGGTGTGAAPIIAKMAKEKNILTVGIVTIPFQFEGKMRLEQSQQGVEKLREVVDSLIVINNNKLREVYGNLGFKAGFSKADEVLSTAARGIAEVITHHYTQNIDLRDAKTVLSNSGTAIMGSSIASGQDRAYDAIRKALDSPLLNDNKITGAKNVLLLIVSGTQEITIDEIGEISDHIQNEAGHGADIIMGVGDDSELEESISVTIIATGFNMEQQDEISNTETKKVIHSLVDTTSSSDKDPVIIEPVIEMDKKTVRHTLDIEEIEDVTFERKENTIIKEEIEEDKLIPTSEFIKNINVVYEEVNTKVEDDDFIIKPVTTMKIEEDIEEEQQQFTLTFDLPLSNKKEEISNKEDKVTFQLDEEAVKEIPVNDYVELITVTETNEEGNDVRYALDDYVEIDSSINNQVKSKPNEIKEEVQEELVFEKKVKHKEDVNKTIEEVDPTELPISEILKQRTEERKRKMKEHNYKFKNLRIDDYEKVPAYKRNGVNLDDAKHSSEKTDISRTSVSFDENEEMKIKTNNSFLHDNVD